ncbi:MAG: PAS domain S-box protein, partial [Leptonema sp. (in: Bacteria)]|nr:PAS domain S-box protein [Leptonema sp. (in: bacteria)]
MKLDSKGSWWRPPKQEREDENLRSSMLKEIFYLVGVLGTSVYIVDLFRLPKLSLRWATGAISVISIVALCLWLLKRGYVNFVAPLFIWLQWVFVTYLVATGGGVNAPLMTAYLILTFMAALVLGARHGLVVGITSSISTLIIALFNEKIPPLPPRPPLSRWFIYSFYIAMVLILQFFSVRSMRRGFQRSMQVALERQKAEESLIESEERFKITFNNTPNAIVILDSDGRLLRSNQAMTDITGYSSDELIGLRFQDITHIDDIEEDTKLYNELFAGIRIRFTFEKRYYRKDGSILWVNTTVSTVSIANNTNRPYAIAIIEDISARREAEHRLIQYQDELENKVSTRTQALRTALKISEETLSGRTQFLAHVSHELRTPLSAILGLTDLLLIEDPTQKQNDYLKRIKSSGNGLLALLNDLLDFSKLEYGKFQIDSIPFSLNQLIDSVTEVVEIGAAKKNLTLIIQTDNQIASTLLGDPVRLRQILINLAGNAVKFTQTGTITIAVQSVESGSSPMIEFSVTDTGIGIPKSVKPQLFQPFQQADKTIAKDFGGTGLGLAICKQIVTQMHGTIGVDDS